MEADKKESFSDWMKIPFARLHHAADFDEYACSPPDATEFMGSCDCPISPLDSVATSKPHENTEKLNMLSKLNQESLHKSGSFSGKPMSSLLAEIVAHGASAPSSKEVTPCGTPQGSPFNSRKTVQTSEAIKCSKTVTKKWFHSGFFGSDMPDNSSCHYSEAKSGKSTFRRFNVSNFDINVVGPTSW